MSFKLIILPFLFLSLLSIGQKELDNEKDSTCFNYYEYYPSLDKSGSIFKSDSSSYNKFLNLLSLFKENNVTVKLHSDTKGTVEGNRMHTTRLATALYELTISKGFKNLNIYGVGESEPLFNYSNSNLTKEEKKNLDKLNKRISICIQN